MASFEQNIYVTITEKPVSQKGPDPEAIKRLSRSIQLR